MKKSIGVDLDGTVLNSLFRHQLVLHDCLKHNKIDIKMADLNDYIEFKRKGFSTKDYLISKNYEKTIINESLKQWVEIIEECKYLKFDCLYAEAFQNIMDIAGSFDLFLVTARHNPKGLFQQVSAFQLDKYFAKIIVVEPKEDAGFQKYTETQSIPFSCIIGDSEVDYVWAQYAKVQFFPVNYGIRNEQWWNSRNLTSYSKFADCVKKI